MIQRISFLFEEDASSRWRIIAITAMSATLCAVVSQYAGARLEVAQQGATIVGCLVFVFQLAHYAWLRPYPTVRIQLVPLRRQVLRPVTALVATGIIAKLLSIEAPRIDAKTAAQELAEAIKRDPPDVAAAHQIIRTAISTNPYIERPLIKEVARKTATLDSPSAWNTYLMSAAYISHGIPWNPVPNASKRPLPGLAFETVHLEVEARAPYPKIFQFGDSVPIKQSAVLTCCGKDVFARTINELGPQYFVVENSSLNLNAAHWINVVVRNVKLTYHWRAIVPWQCVFCCLHL